MNPNITFILSEESRLQSLEQQPENEEQPKPEEPVEEQLEPQPQARAAAPKRKR